MDMQLDLFVGDEFQGGDVLAFHEQENHGVAGVVLTFNAKDRYQVWLIDAHLSVVDSDRYSDGDKAYFRYAERVTQELFRYHNRIAPGLSFNTKNNG